MKQSECSGSNCKGLLTSKWHRIKCFPLPTSRRKGLCSKWCNKYSSDQICFKNSDEKLNFEVVHCRSFEFNIRLESMVSSEYFPSLFLFDPFYFIFLLFLLLLLFVILNSAQVNSSKTFKVCSSIWLLMGGYKNILTTWKASEILKSVSISKDNSDSLLDTRPVTLPKEADSKPFKPSFCTCIFICKDLLLLNYDIGLTINRLHLTDRIVLGKISLRWVNDYSWLGKETFGWVVLKDTTLHLRQKKKKRKKERKKRKQLKKKSGKLLSFLQLFAYLFIYQPIKFYLYFVVGILHFLLSLLGK